MNKTYKHLRKIQITTKKKIKKLKNIEECKREEKIEDNNKTELSEIK